jgi:hypothetical protein
MKLLDLPTEVLERILIISQSQSLPVANRLFKILSTPTRVRAFWLAQKYKDKVFLHCWRLKFMRGSCSCSIQNIQSHCHAEDYEMEILSHLVKHQLGQIEDGMIGAAAKGHLKIVEWLLNDGADCNVKILPRPSRFHRFFSFLSSTPRGQSRQSLLSPFQEVYVFHGTSFIRPSDTKAFALLQKAVECNYIELVTLLVRHTAKADPEDESSPKVSRLVIQQSLAIALKNLQSDMAHVLIHQGGARTTIKMLKDLFHRAAFRKLLFGNVTKYQDTLVVALEGLSDEDLDTRTTGILKYICELGCIPALKVCLDRGVDINLSNGIALMSAIYNANFDLLKYLIENTTVNLETFGAAQTVFCCSLMAIETLAISLFLVLSSAWLVALIQTVIGMVRGEKMDTWLSVESLSVWELTGIAVPSLTAIAFMYHLVPIHRMAQTLWYFNKEKRQRRRAQAIPI